MGLDRHKRDFPELYFEYTSSVSESDAVTRQ